MKEEGRGKMDEGRRMKEEGRRKKKEGRRDEGRWAKTKKRHPGISNVVRNIRDHMEIFLLDPGLSYRPSGMTILI